MPPGPGGRPVRRAPVRARLLVAFAICACFSISGVSRAEEPSVPFDLQAQLMAKVAAYDRNLPRRASGPRAAGKVRVLLVTRDGHAEAVRAAAQIASALAELASIAGLAHEETAVAFAGAPALAQTCRERGASIVYVMPGLDAEAEAIARALTGSDILSVTTSRSAVPRGLVLGFDLVAGRPTLLVNLSQARQQNVALKPELLRLAKVFE